MQPFIFVSDPSVLYDDQALTLEVDPTLVSKEALLSWFANRLEFPDHFGSNWDAFDETLRDLSWIKQRKIVIFHRDLPMAGFQKDRKIYLEVLAHVVRDWQSDESHEFIAAFDPSCELKLYAAMRDG